MEHISQSAIDRWLRKVHAGQGILLSGSSAIPEVKLGLGVFRAGVPDRVADKDEVEREVEKATPQRLHSAPEDGPPSSGEMVLTKPHTPHVQPTPLAGGGRPRKRVTLGDERMKPT